MLEVQPGETEEARKIRLINWLDGQDEAGKFHILPTEPSAFKKVYTSPDAPSLVLKRFHPGTRYKEFQTERNLFDFLSKQLGETYVPKTVFIHNEYTPDPDKKYDILQERLEGAHLGTAISIASSRHDALKLKGDPLAIEHETSSEAWPRYRGKVLQENLTDTQRVRSRMAAQNLYSKMLRIEQSGRIVFDLDFFITPVGEIKITDCQMDTIEVYEKTYVQGQDYVYPSGSEEIRLLFDL